MEQVPFKKKKSFDCFAVLHFYESTAKPVEVLHAKNRTDLKAKLAQIPLPYNLISVIAGKKLSIVQKTTFDFLRESEVIDTPVDLALPIKTQDRRF